MDIREMRDMVQKKASLKAKLLELHRQKDELKESIRELGYQKDKEQSDIDRLEKGGLSSFLHQIMGRREEKLDKERQEAYAAAVKYETAVGQLEAVNKDIRDLEKMISETGNIELQLEAALRERKEWLKTHSEDKGARILEKEERIAWLHNQQREIEEAINVGSRAVRLAEQINRELDSAHGWGVYDMVGGGLLADMVKHSHLDTAQEQINSLQSELRNFKKELADVSMNEQMRVQVDGFLKFADFFWDGLFTDILVLDRIKKSQNQMQTCLISLNRAMSRLETMKNDTRREAEAAENAICTLVENA